MVLRDRIAHHIAPPTKCTPAQGALSLVALVAIGLAGCGPLIPESTFLEFASAFALDPAKTCEQLKGEFDVPQLTTVDHPGEIGLEYDEEYVHSAGGVPLRVWYLPHAQRRGTIVFSNGAVGEIACYLLIAKTLHEHGWAFVMYDFQGFGGSGGTPDLASLYGDLEAVLDWTLAKPEVEEVTLMGVSLGSIPSVAHAAARPEQVNALLLDGLISLQSEVERFRFLFAWRPAAYYGQFDEILRLQLQIRDVRQPVLAVIYGRDEYATSAQARSILATSPAPATILDFPDLKHARGPYLAGERYFENVLEFLDSVWEGDAE